MKKGLIISIAAVVLPLLCIVAQRWGHSLAMAERGLATMEAPAPHHSLPTDDEREYADLRLMCPASAVSSAQTYSKWGSGTASECQTHLARLFGQTDFIHPAIAPGIQAAGRGLINRLHRLLI